MATYTEGNLRNARGQNLHTVSFTPAGGAPKAIVFFHHGYGEHIGRYKTVFTSLAEAGIAVHSYDTHAHGKSEPTDPNARALIWRFQDLIDDFILHRDEVAKQYQTMPPAFSMGHSMGGLVAATAVLRQQDKWTALILHSALVDIEWNPILRVQSTIGGLLAALVPRARLVPAVDPNEMSVDPAVVEHYKSDPLNFIGNVRARTANVLLQGFRQLASCAGELRLPIYACHGSADTTTSLPAVKRLVAGAQSQDTTIKVIEGAKHELLMGPEREECMESLIGWINGHLGVPKL